jgi:hypothetical protein
MSGDGSARKNLALGVRCLAPLVVHHAARDPEAALPSQGSDRAIPDRAAGGVTAGKILPGSLSSVGNVLPGNILRAPEGASLGRCQEGRSGGSGS